VVERYRSWLLTRPELLARLHELRGSVLACWCRFDQACHADVLIELVDADETLAELLAAGVRPEVVEDRLRLHGVEKAGQELVERARRHKVGIRSLLAARRPPVPLDAGKLWIDALDRLAAEGLIPPELLDECKAAMVKLA